MWDGEICAPESRGGGGAFAPCRGMIPITQPALALRSGVLKLDWPVALIALLKIVRNPPRLQHSNGVGGWAGPYTGPVLTLFSKPRELQQPRSRHV